ncbi:tRNA adenosine(34) deaminase TadA [Xianfuyuplasma coldseepsis]|uniref:tRNA-specific adenosine deaminase n=1 Tax=Candidatus Xianfuyuplasma coldseepsis TaxID=2782163 RepID=A0A7L7KS51_9MOLU|nr:nucleoside deaminase [Xianfuyuplasma coldseepsis]
MKKALKEAKKAYKKGEVPIGAVIVHNGKIIAKAHNLREKARKATAHAEILAIEKANKKLKSWRLDTCTMYVTIEPCPMCAGAIIQSRMKQVIYGAKEYKTGAHQSITNLFDKPFNHKVEVLDGIMEEECGKIITSFFKKLRTK